MSTYQPQYRLSEKILHLSMEISMAVQQIVSLNDLSRKPHLHRANRIQSVYSSLSIENNSLSMDQVSAVLEGKRVLAPQQEIAEVQNAFRAYDLIPSLDPYSIEDLLTAHRTMMHTLTAEAGMFRSGDVGVFSGTKLLHAGTPAQYVPEVMQQLFNWLKQETITPLVQSCVFHYEFEFIHPFADGNGRTGRLWQTLILQKWQPLFAYLPVESMILNNRLSYYDALNNANASGDCTCFIEFMLEMILNALRDVLAGQNNIADRTSPEGQLLMMLTATPELTIAEMANSIGLSDRQVRRLLTSLKEQGKLHREGSNKNGKWIVTFMS